MSYNGWTNYETWNAVLWIDNDEGIYRERVRRHRWDEWTGDEVASFFLEVFPNGTPDMKKKDIGKIDWDEIARNWNDEYCSEEEE